MTRCPRLDDDGCRCLRPAKHDGPCDYSYTPWLSVQEARARIPQGHDRLWRVAHGFARNGVEQ